MKSERRHELQTNTLYVELRRISEFCKTNSNRIVWVAFAAAVLILGVVLVERWQSKKVADRQAMFERAMGDMEQDTDLKQLADQTSDKRIASLSCVAMGDRAARRALMSTSAAERSSSLEEAATWYGKVTSQFSQETLSLAKAKYGLAKLAETTGDLDKARTLYGEVIGMPSMNGNALAFLAKESLEKLDSLASPVKMATTRPAPASAPAVTASQPVAAPAATSTPAVKAEEKPKAVAVTTKPAATTRPAK